MNPHFKTLPARTFIGKRLSMSLSCERVQELWMNFMPRKKEITQVIGDELYSIEEYPEGYFLRHDPATSFDKWAVVQVSPDTPVPEGMEKLSVPAGGYAVFHYKGPMAEAFRLFNYIFNQWLPDSDFEIDRRPHIAVMGIKYSNHAIDSEEDFYIPVKPKRTIE